MLLSGKFEFPSGNCQGNVREFCFHLSVATLNYMFPFCKFVDLLKARNV